MLDLPPSQDAMRLQIDRASNTIRLVREFAAPPEEVFDAWTVAEHISRWWDPGGEPLLACEIDLRVGGAFRFVSASHPAPFAGTYHEISRPDRLVFDAMGSTGRVLLQPHEGGARMTVEIECRSPEHLEEFLALGVDQGTARTLDNLVADLA